MGKTMSMQATEPDTYGEAGGYFSIIPSRACRDRSMHGRLLQLLCLLGTYTSAKKRGLCWPALDTLAAEMGVTRTAVIKGLHRLEALGYIEIRKRKRPDGGDTSNMYRVLYDPELPAERDTGMGGGNLQRLQGGQPPEVTRGSNLQRLQGGQPLEVTRRANGKAEGEGLNHILAPEARQGAAAKQPSQSTAPDPERAELRAALERYPQYFGVPRTANEGKLWNMRLTSLLSGGFRAGDVPRAVNAWKRKYPGAQLTINALDMHLGELVPPPPTSPTTAPTPITPPLPNPHNPAIACSAPSGAVTAAELEGLTPDEQRLYLATFDPATRFDTATRARCQDGSATQQPADSGEERRRAASERARAALARASERATTVVPHRRGLPAGGGQPVQV
jgi:hypothetical protein